MQHPPHETPHQSVSQGGRGLPRVLTGMVRMARMQGGVVNDTDLCKCGHPVYHHEAGICWTDTEGNETWVDRDGNCDCDWLEVAS